MSITTGARIARSRAEAPEPVRTMTSARHTAHFYDDDHGLIDLLARFVESAWHDGDSALVLATSAHRDALEQRLRASGIDLDRELARGTYVSADADALLQACLVDGVLSGDRFRAVIRPLIAGVTPRSNGTHRRLRIFGELVVLLTDQNRYDDAIELERLWNELGQRHDFTLLCAYPMTAFNRSSDQAAMERVCDAHSHIVPLESYTSITNEPERLRAIAMLQQKERSLEREIAERERISRLLLERNRELEEALAARDAFLAVAAHELRTPISGLRAFSQLLMRDLRANGEVATDRLHRGLDAIERQSGKLSRLVSRLLDVGQIESGKLRIDRATGDLVTVIESAIAHQRQSDLHTIEYHGPAELVTALDPDRMEQVIANLLENAITFSPNGGTVRIELALHDDEIRLEIVDPGVGVTPELREAVFSRFYRSEQHPVLAGMGLSLFVSREIVALHGGTIRFVEPKGPGARCLVTLPVAPQQPHPARDA